MANINIQGKDFKVDKMYLSLSYDSESCFAASQVIYFFVLKASKLQYMPEAPETRINFHTSVLSKYL